MTTEGSQQGSALLVAWSDGDEEALKNLVPLIQAFASLAGGNLPSDTFDNLRPLRSFLAWTEGTGDTRSFDAFLEIK